MPTFDKKFLLSLVSSTNIEAICYNSITKEDWQLFITR